MRLLRDMREMLKMLSHRRPVEIFCPRCGSLRIHLSTGLNYLLAPKKYVCEDCGYAGPVVMEIEEEQA